MTATAWDRLHPRLTHRAAWLDHPGDLTHPGGHPDPAAGQPPARRPGSPAGAGCGPRTPAPHPPTSTGSGRHTCAASTWSTPSS
ncbi:hypothetical protein LI90_2515 [Carbonactinospora thermoautotrophica]|uniref:Uncharacterized protein n=1 Tax=Carbonactinospora thermoautotrophica TaxID=1469144 RepID=A0A132MUG1_9ACTN|nr:hypothetical protein LI90_2515 [Carbonactinospora thermoautotrophica]